MDTHEIVTLLLELDTKLSFPTCRKDTHIYVEEMYPLREPTDKPAKITNETRLAQALMHNIPPLEGFKLGPGMNFCVLKGKKIYGFESSN